MVGTLVGARLNPARSIAATKSSLVDSVGYNEPELNQLKKIVTVHVALFSERWDEYFGG